jgi:hypothetical protein
MKVDYDRQLAILMPSDNPFSSASTLLVIDTESEGRRIARNHHHKNKQWTYQYL